jgi:hypothetical protein
MTAARSSRHAARRKLPLIICADWRWASSGRQSQRDQDKIEHGTI